MEMALQDESQAFLLELRRGVGDAKDNQMEACRHRRPLQPDHLFVGNPPAGQDNTPCAALYDARQPVGEFI